MEEGLRYLTILLQASEGSVRRSRARSRSSAALPVSRVQDSFDEEGNPKDESYEKRAQSFFVADSQKPSPCRKQSTNRQFDIRGNSDE